MSVTRTLLICIFLVSALIIIGEFVARTSTKQTLSCADCNVILISIDTFGAKHSSVYTPSLHTTPFLEELASRSIVFENAFSQAPWTLASHSAMLTGQYPWDLNIWKSSDLLPDRAYTLAESLQQSGYHTAAFSGGAFVQKSRGFGQGFDEFTGSLNLYGWNDIPQLFQDSATWVTNYHETKPFFLFIRPFGLHDPYHDKETGKEIEIEDIVAANSNPGGPSKEDTERFVRAYRDDLEEVDAALRAFFEDLKTAGVADKTIVIITSDHGEEFGEHGTIGFHSIGLYRESLHVPLIIALPSKVSKRIEANVEIRSIPSTVRELLGLQTEARFEGTSLVPLIRGSVEDARTVLAQTHQERNDLLSRIVGYYRTIQEPHLGLPEQSVPYLGPRAVSVLEGDWHAIRQINGAVELYHTTTDINEHENLADKVLFLPNHEREQAAAVLQKLQSL